MTKTGERIIKSAKQAADMAKTPERMECELVERLRSHLAHDLDAQFHGYSATLSVELIANAADRIQALEAENRDLYHEIENYNVQANEHIEALSGVHAGTHCIVPTEITEKIEGAVKLWLWTFQTDDNPLDDDNPDKIYRAMIAASKDT